MGRQLDRKVNKVHRNIMAFVGLGVFILSGVRCSNAFPNLGLNLSNSNYSYTEFGNGGDGSPTISTSFTTTTLIGNGNTKKASATARVISVSPDGSTLTLTPTPNMVKSPGFNASLDDIDVGDEVTWMVVAANSPDGPDNACGGNLYRGNYYGNFAHVTAIITNDGFVSNVTLDRPLAQPAYVADIISKNNLANSFLSSSFCLLQLVRVPNVVDMTINSSGAFTFNPAPLDMINTGFSGSNPSVLIQDSRGGILAGGGFGGYNGNTTGGLVRINADGSQDFTFNPMGTGFNGAVSAMAIDVNGKIIVAGNFSSFIYAGTSWGQAANGIVRLNADGSPDLSFTTSGSLASTIYALAVDSANRIIVGGSFTGYSGYSYLMRLNATGTVDTTFGTGTGPNNSVLTVYAEASGKIAFGGAFTTFAGSSFGHIARVNSDGSIDTGVVLTNAFDNTVDVITEDSAGNIYVGGAFQNFASTATPGIAKLSNTCVLDSTFMANVGTAVGTGTVYSLALVPTTSQLLVAGSFSSFAGHTPANLVRLNINGIFDSTFDGGLSGPNSAINSVINFTGASSNGVPVITGNFSSFNGVAINYFLRLTIAGTPDFTTYNLGTGLGGIIALKVQDTLTFNAASSSTISFNADYAGFAGAPGFGGATLFGMGPAGLSSNDEGGGTPTSSASGGAGGGGNQGIGGAGAGTSAGAAGRASTYCPGQCTADNKVFFGGGGGGGANTTAVGGAGGGIVTIYARNVVVNGPGTTTLSAFGRAGFSAGAGGGAGGAVLLETQSISGAGALTINASGGNGGAFTYGGGGGGGGAVEINTCTATVSAPSLIAVGGSGSAGGGSGSNGSTQVITGNARLCAIP